MDTDSFVLTLNSSNIVKVLQNFEYFLDFSYLIGSHDFLNLKTKKLLLILK